MLWRTSTDSGAKSMDGRGWALAGLEVAILAAEKWGKPLDQDALKEAAKAEYKRIYGEPPVPGESTGPSTVEFGSARTLV